MALEPGRCAPYMPFSLKNPRPIMTNSHVLEIWREEFREIYKSRGLFNLVCLGIAAGPYRVHQELSRPGTRQYGKSRMLTARCGINM